MVPIRRNVVLEALGLINQGSASAKPRGSAPWVIDMIHADNFYALEVYAL